MYADPKRINFIRRTSMTPQAVKFYFLDKPFPCIFPLSSFYSFVNSEHPQRFENDIFPTLLQTTYTQSIHWWNGPWWRNLLFNAKQTALFLQTLLSPVI